MKLGRVEVDRGTRSLTLRCRGNNALVVMTVTSVALCGAAVGLGAAGDPFVAIVGMIPAGTMAAIVAAMWADMIGASRFIRRPREIDVRAAGAGLRLAIDGERVELGRVRGVQLRSVATGTGDIVTVFLVLDDRAFVVDAARDRAPMEQLADELRASLSLAHATLAVRDRSPMPAALLAALLLSADLTAMIVVWVAELADRRRVTVADTALVTAWTIAIACAGAIVVGAIGRRVARRRVRAFVDEYRVKD